MSYKFRIRANTTVGEVIGIVGSIEELGNWNPDKALRLTTDKTQYPLWTAVSDIDVSSLNVEKIEYKYCKLSSGPPGSQKAASKAPVWESTGSNRWVPIERGLRITVDDGGFGYVQPFPFGFIEDAPKPVIEPPGEGGLKVVLIGSSVADGYNAWLKKGWAYLLGEALRAKYGHAFVNVSESGSNVERAIQRFPTVVTPHQPDVVIIGLSLGNEGIGSCPPHQRPAAQRRFESGIMKLLTMVRSIGASPVLGGVYPNGDFKPEHDHFLKQTYHNMSKLGVPVLDWLSKLDDGKGRWQNGIWFDPAHPNTLGHQRMFEAIDLSIFDPKRLQASSSSSCSRPLLKDPTPHTSHQHDPSATPEEGLVFRDAAGFRLYALGLEQKIRVVNDTNVIYKVSPTWIQLQDALRAMPPPTLKPGLYICTSPDQPSAPAMFVGTHGGIETACEVPANTTLEYTAAFVLFSPGVSQVLYYDSQLGVLSEDNGSVLRIINESDKEYNVHPMWFELRESMKSMRPGVYDSLSPAAGSFSTILIGANASGLQSRVKVPARSSLMFKYSGPLSSLHRYAIVPLGHRCSIRMLLYKLEYDGPCFPFDLTRTEKLSDIADMVQSDFHDMWNPDLLTYSHDEGRIFHKKWTGLSFAHEVEDGDDPINNAWAVFNRMRSRYSQRAARFRYVLRNADEVIFIRTGYASRGEVEDLVHKLQSKYEGKKFRIVLLSSQSSHEFHNVPSVSHYQHDFNPDTMHGDPQYWLHCANVLKDILSRLGITSRNLFWCPPNPKDGPPASLNTADSVPTVTSLSSTPTETAPPTAGSHESTAPTVGNVANAPEDSPRSVPVSQEKVKEPIRKTDHISNVLSHVNLIVAAREWNVPPLAPFRPHDASLLDGNDKTAVSLALSSTQSDTSGNKKEEVHQPGNGSSFTSSKLPEEEKEVSHTATTKPADSMMANGSPTTTNGIGKIKSDDSPITGSPISTQDKKPKENGSKALPSGRKPAARVRG